MDLPFGIAVDNKYTRAERFDPDLIRIRFDLRRILSRKWSGNMSDVFGIRFGKFEKSVIFDLK